MALSPAELARMQFLCRVAGKEARHLGETAARLFAAERAATLGADQDLVALAGAPLAGERGPNPRPPASVRKPGAAIAPSRLYNAPPMPFRRPSASTSP